MTTYSDRRISRRRLSGLLIALVLPAVAACQTAPTDLESSAQANPKVVEVPAGAVEEAEATLAAGRYEQAGRHFLRILAVDPQNVRAKLGVAEVFLATGEPDKAAATFRDVGQLEEVRAQALQGEGIALLAAGHLTEARERLEEAVASDPSLWRAWNALGQIYDSERQWADSRRSYDRALELKPGSAMVLNNRGFSLLLQGEYEQATADFMKALELDLGLATARANLRLALAWQGRYAEAVAGVERIDLPRTLNNIGYVAFLRGDYERAEAYLTRAMEASPSFFEVARKNLETLESFRYNREPSTPPALEGNEGASPEMDDWTKS